MIYNAIFDSFGCEVKRSVCRNFQCCTAIKQNKKSKEQLDDEQKLSKNSNMM